ncbi:hypothetical protein FMUND_12066 [Fusarium mundagurra]|uniref:Uncharacterized protein n=1 Tax=Fusarium mundagurra TaxID=1567541 RepID=A0A8H6D5Z6_9HYPO|nr:hypothetical protein FMUND_12066 [Fusarium mundagurra]
MSSSDQEPWWMPKFLDSQESLDPAQALQAVTSLEAPHVLWLVPLKVGDFGIIHTGGNNSLSDGGLVDYPTVQLLRRTDKGIEAGYGTTLLEGRAGLCQVPEKASNLELSSQGLTGTFKNFDCYIHYLNLPNSRNIWIRTKAPQTVGIPAIWSFRTQRELKHVRRRERGHNTSVKLFHTQWSQDSKISLFEASVPQEGTPLEEGSAVNVIIEITIDPGVEHSHSYLQFPLVRPFDSSCQAFRVGIRLEFQDEGEVWKSEYLSSTRHFPVLSLYKSLKVEDLGNELNHIDLSWLNCMKTLATLLNWRWKPEDNPVRENLTQAVWVPYCIRLLSIDFDFHNQRLVLDETQSVEMQCPRLLAQCA